MTYEKWLSDLKKNSPCSIKLNGVTVIDRINVTDTFYIKRNAIGIYRKQIEVNKMIFDGYNGKYKNKKNDVFQIFPLDDLQDKNKNFKIINYIKSFFKREEK